MLRGLSSQELTEWEAFFRYRALRDSQRRSQRPDRAAGRLGRRAETDRGGDVQIAEPGKPPPLLPDHLFGE